MAGTPPIRLGSAVSGWTFESGSSIETSTSGIQTISVKALWPAGDTILSNLPAAGASVSTIESTGYIPSSFVLDYSESGPAIEYLEGRIAEATFRFKRQDPGQLGVRRVFVDSVINYESPLNQNTLTIFNNWGGGTDTHQTFGPFGFPEPVTTVKYNTTTAPGIGTGSLPQLYALPGSANASGFPATPSIFNNISIPVAVGSTVMYSNDGVNIITVGPLTVETTFNFVTEYRLNLLGWQLTKLKSDPVAAGAFYDVEEQWRAFYFCHSTQLINTVPPLPP